MTAESVLRLARPLERAIRDGHPWVYRDAVTGSAAPGEIATLVDRTGQFVARGVADGGPIALRVFTTRDEQVDEGLFRARIERAAQLRERVVPPMTTAYRLLHGEGDRVPGFVCDVYGSVAVIKTDGDGALAQRDAFVRALRPTLAARGIDTLLARVSGRAKDTGPKAAVLFGTLAEPVIDVLEHGMALRVDLLHGQKTGLFLDQRESRARVRAVSRGMRVLNLYAYTGGFSVAAGLGDATHVETVDVAPAAVALAEATWMLNGLDPQRHRATVADVPFRMAALTRERARFDLVIADPPSFAPREDAVTEALKSYRALHASAFGLLPPGGYYLAGSCSSHIDRAALLETVLDASRKQRRVVQQVDAWGAPADHPTLPAFPEGDYLKVLLFRVE